MSDMTTAFVSLAVIGIVKERFIKYFERSNHGVSDVFVINMPNNLFVILIIPKDEQTSDNIELSFKEGSLKRNGWHKYFAKQEIIKIGLA